MTGLPYDWNRTLTSEEMDGIKDAIDGNVGFAAAEVALVRFYSIALHDLGTTWDEVDSIDGTRFVMDEDQWQQICSWVLQARTEDVNGALMWMNKGPSARKVA